MRRAFVMGSNGPADGRVSPLRYALQDAERVRACLAGARCGFEVTMPEQGIDVFDVRRKLTLVTDSCTPDDTFVCYFSGHGTLAMEGGLFLLWDNTNLDRLISTALPVADIMQALKYCKANSKLLILDCCHAGAVANMHGFKDAEGVPVQELEIRPDNYFVLMASARLERARELEMLQGSFLTTYINAALEEKFAEADRDKDGRISVQELHQWVEERAKIHNQLYPDTRVSYPFLLGKQQGEFYLTLAASAWVPYELTWPDGSTMVVLPIHPMSRLMRRRLGLANSYRPSALCISKYPITNAQYKRFVKDGRGKEPVGEHYISQPEEITQHAASEQKGISSWQGPFYPWNTEDFRDPEKPVVCVDFHDAKAYCDWVNGLNTQYGADTTLPDPALWDFAAFGMEFPSYDPDTMLARNQRIHHKSSAPAAIDRTGARSNNLGVSDLLGNIWEWCEQSTDALAGLGIQEPPIELRGGGFLDDLSRVKPAISHDRLKDGLKTCHSDLGFRIAAAISIDDLPEEIQQRLLPAGFDRR